MSAVLRAYAPIGGRQLHYRYAGYPDAPALLLLHQSPSTSAMYEPLMAALADRYFLVAPDNPGFGGSDALEPGYGVEDLSAAVAALLDELAIASCYVFGHHSGAAVAVQLAADQPSRYRALALSGPTLLSEQQRRDLPESVNPFPIKDDGGHLVQMWGRIHAKDPEAPRQLIQREVLSALASGDDYQGTYRAVCGQDFAALLPDLECPVLVFAGDEDPLRGGVEPSLELLRNGSTASLPAGSRTYLCERQVREVTDMLAAFFETPVTEGVNHGPG